jgi:uncharacterized membrane protein YoaK (UPF0700 family)
MKLLSPDARSERRLAVCLALIAGYVDAYALRVFATYVSFMSGNTTQTGALTGRGKLASALFPALAIAFFVAGSVAGAWLTLSGRRHSRWLLFGVVSTLLAVVIGLTQLGVLGAATGIATLSLAMGMLNTTLSRVGGEPASLTFVTGDLSRIGSHLALSARRAPLPDAQGQWDTHLHRAGLLARVWAGFLAGAALSGAATSYFGVLALLAPLLILLALFAGAEKRSWVTSGAPRERNLPCLFGSEMDGASGPLWCPPARSSCSAAGASRPTEPPQGKP